MVTTGRSALRAIWRRTRRRRGMPRARCAAREILRPGLRHAVAHEAQIERQIDEAERGHRQDQSARRCRARGEMPVLPDAIVSMPPTGSQRRSTAKMTIKHKAEPEAGHGIDGDRADRESAVAPAARPRAGDDAEGRAEPRRRARSTGPSAGACSAAAPASTSRTGRSKAVDQPRSSAEEGRSVGEEAAAAARGQGPIRRAARRCARRRRRRCRRDRHRPRRRAPPPAAGTRRSPRSAGAAPRRPDAAAGDGERAARLRSMAQLPGSTPPGCSPSDSKQRSRTSLPARATPAPRCLPSSKPPSAGCWRRSAPCRWRR